MKSMSRHRLVSRRLRHESNVATWLVGKRSRDMKLMSRHMGVPKRVATWFWCRYLAWGLGRKNGVATPFGGRDLEWPERCRDTNLMSRHGLFLVGWKGGRDMGLVSRPGLLLLGSRPGLFSLVSRPGHCSGYCLDHCS